MLHNAGLFSATEDCSAGKEVESSPQFIAAQSRAVQYEDGAGNQRVAHP